MYDSTMSYLLSPAFSTNNTKKRKSKIKITPELLKEHKAHNKLMKKTGLKTKTLEEYVLYRQGKYNPNLGSAIQSPVQAKSYQRETKQLPSNGTFDVSLAVKPKQYTGTLIKGIAVMHKSNSVPVISKKAMEEISKMRRG